MPLGVGWGLICALQIEGWEGTRHSRSYGKTQRWANVKRFLKKRCFEERKASAGI